MIGIITEFFQVKKRPEVMELIGGRDVVPGRVWLQPKRMLLSFCLFVFRASACRSGAHA